MLIYLIIKLMEFFARKSISNWWIKLKSLSNERLFFNILITYCQYTYNKMQLITVTTAMSFGSSQGEIIRHCSRE